MPIRLNIRKKKMWY